MVRTGILVTILAGGVAAPEDASESNRPHVVVPWPFPFGVLDRLSFLQFREIDFHDRSSVKEYVVPFRADESKPSIGDDSLDLFFGHASAFH